MILLNHFSGYLVSALYKLCCLETQTAEKCISGRGWSGGAKVLDKLSVPGKLSMPGKLSVPGDPINLDNDSARAYSACSRCGWGCLNIFPSSIFFLFSFSFSGRRPDID